MWVINKRIPRNLRAGKIKWGAILLIEILCIYYMISVLGSDLTSLYNHDRNFTNNKARDGRFTALTELYDDELQKAEKLGFDIEKECYMDFPIMEESKVRIFRNRKKVDLVFSDKGRQAETDSEVLLEKHFCEFNNINVGDKINIAGIEFEVSGIGGAADAEYVFDIEGETTDHSKFANGYVTDEGYERLKNAGKMIGSEIYRYGYRKHDKSMKDDTLEHYLRDMEFDENRIENKYFKEMLSALLETKFDLENSIKDMNEACDELENSSDDFDSSAKEMCNAAEEFCDVINNDLVSGIVALADGVEKLDNNSDKLNEGTDQIFDLFLTNAENSLRDYGVNVELTKDNYVNVLSSVDLYLTVNQYEEIIDSLINSLNQVESFCNGVYTYTTGVSNAEEGSSELMSASAQLSVASAVFIEELEMCAAVPELAETAGVLSENYEMINEGICSTSNGISQLYSALETINAESGRLIDGSDQIFDLLLRDISTRVRDYGVSVTLTRNNYVSVLNDVKNGLNSQISDAARASIGDLIDSIDSYKGFSDGLKEYTAGVKELHDGINELNDTTPNLIENSESLHDAALEFADHTAELKEGVREFSDAIGGFNDNMDEMDELFNFDFDIIETFEPLSYNTGIYNTAQNEKHTVEMCEILVFMIIGFIFTVFISQDLDNDSAVIGALYSMGVKKTSLIFHYMIIPVLIAFFGGVVGTILGISPIGIKLMNNNMENFYSMPKFVYHFDIRLLIMGVIVPVLISSVITVVIINMKLSKSPLSLLRHEKKIKSIKVRKLEKMTFLSAFRIKQFFAEISTSVIVFVGMLLSLTLLLYSLNFIVAIPPALNGVEKDIRFEELCIMKYAPKEIPDGAEEAYVESGTIGRCNINVMGIESNSKCFGFSVKDNGINKISVGSGTALKYGLEPGDLFTINFTDSHRYYTFEVENIVDFSPGLYIFMNIDDMRQIFGVNDDFYNALISDNKINIEKERMFAYYTKDSIMKSVHDGFGNSFVSIVMFIIITVLSFVIITFLMIKLMIDRARMNISLLRVFGYNRSEIKKLYIDGNFYLILFSVLAGIPIAKLFVDKIWFPVATYGMDIGYDTRYPIWLYLLIITSVIVLYFIVSNILRIVINKIKVSEILKNRE